MMAADTLYGRVDPRELYPSERELRARLGTPAKGIEGLSEAFSELCSYASPAYMSCTSELSFKDGIPTLLGVPLDFPGAERWLKGAGRVRLLALTLGFSLERRLSRPGRFSGGDLLLDALGSAMAEALADRAEGELFGEGPHGKRFSPGYGGMPLELGERIVAHLGAGVKLGIAFTAAHAMIPSKSITAIIPIWEDENAN